MNNRAKPIPNLVTRSTVTESTPYGWSCTIRGASGMVLAYGFAPRAEFIAFDAHNRELNTRAEAVARAFDQLA